MCGVDREYLQNLWHNLIMKTNCPYCRFIRLMIIVFGIMALVFLYMSS